ncbi:MAG: DsbA family protein [Anaerolineales bacterium]
MPRLKKSDEIVQFKVKRHHLYAAFTPVAFLAGLGAGFLVWGSPAATPADVVALPTSAAGSQADDIVAQRYDIPIDDDDRILGATDAPITIIEFADFQCPYCQRHALETYPLLVENYGDQIRFVYKDFPLTSIHPEAFPSALASHCAHEQDKFWEFHDLLYSGRLELGSDAYTAYAEELGLDMDQFSTCFAEQRYADAVQADYTFASQLGVSSTPTFFVNGIAVVGAQPYSVFAQIIDYELENQAN